MVLSRVEKINNIEGTAQAYKRCYCAETIFSTIGVRLILCQSGKVSSRFTSALVVLAVDLYLLCIQTNSKLL